MLLLFLNKEYKITLRRENKMNNPLEAKITVNMDDLRTVVCKCGEAVFENVAIYKVVPALYSGNGKPTLLGRPCIRCVKCGEVYAMDEVTTGPAS